jgi:hypothetical protein
MKNLRALRKEEHGAGEWGTPELTNKYKSETPGQQDEGLEKACWKGYEAIGTKQKNGRTVPNCVPKEGHAEDAQTAHQAAHAALKKGDIDTYHKEMDKKFASHQAASAEAAKKPVKTYEETDEQKNLKITKHEKAAIEAGKKGDKDSQEYHLNAVKNLQKESVVSEATKAEPQKHIVTVTVTDPHHAMTTKRKEKIMKRVKVSAMDPKQAVKKAEAHYKKHGFKVHDSLHHSIVKESLDTDEFIDSYDPEQKNESADPHEAEEIAMAKGQFAEIADMAKELVDAMDDTDELEPWMHSKITTAYVNLDDVYSYIAYGDKYSTDDSSEDETSKEDIGEATEQEPAVGGEEETAGLSDEEKAQIGKIKTLIRLGLIDNSQMQVTLRAIKKLDLDQPVTSSVERQAINALVQQLIGVVTGDDTVFRKIRLNVQK